MERRFRRLHDPSSYNGEKFGVTNGDTVTATILGNVITAYKNGVQQGQVTDSTFSSGSPGVGFNLTNDTSGCPGTNANYDSAASPRWIARKVHSRKPCRMLVGMMMPRNSG
jgi:hypothetical protein